MVKIILMTVFLSGCQIFPTKIVYQDVFIPVNICEKPINIERPILPIIYINKNTSDEDVVKSYKSSVKILQTYSIKLEEALEVYK